MAQARLSQNIGQKIHRETPYIGTIRHENSIFLYSKSRTSP
jgi:hypothetical protein